MARHFVPLPMDEFKKKIEEAFYEEEYIDTYLVTDKLEKDLKVEFSTENFEDKAGEAHGTSKDKHPDLCGYHTLPNGMNFLGMTAGGDWEYPVFFIAYWDGKKIRGYVPTDGNAWNTTTKTAYGNDEVADLKNAKKRWPDVFADKDDPEDIEPGDFWFDYKLIEKDITERITLHPNLTKKPTLEQRVNAMTYYGTGAEDYELWRGTVSLAYQMFGLGDEKKAETLCKWAEEMAIASKENIEDQDDYEKGYWGG